MKVGTRSINFTREVMEKNLEDFKKYFKESGIEKRSGAKAEDVHKGFKGELAKLDKK
jgi:hypothetical protein